MNPSIPSYSTSGINFEEERDAYELERQERINQQKQCYQYLEELQSMASELPPKYQQRISHDVIIGLSSAVLDGNVFDLVEELQQKQQSLEHGLFQQRQKCINQLKTQKMDLERRHHDELLRVQQLRPHDLARIQVTHAEQKESQSKKEETEVRRVDMRVIRELDQATSDQQLALQKASVPGFSVTNNPSDIKIQMIILDWLQRLAKSHGPKHF